MDTCDLVALLCLQKAKAGGRRCATGGRRRCRWGAQLPLVPQRPSIHERPAPPLPPLLLGFSCCAVPGCPAWRSTTVCWPSGQTWWRCAGAGRPAAAAAAGHSPCRNHSRSVATAWRGSLQGPMGVPLLAAAPAVQTAGAAGAVLLRSQGGDPAGGARLLWAPRAVLLRGLADFLFQ